MNVMIDLKTLFLIVLGIALLVLIIYLKVLQVERSRIGLTLAIRN